jgi:hypothetical protein
VWSTHCSIPQHPYLVLILPLRFPFQVPLLYVLVVGLLFLGGPVVAVLALTAQPCCLGTGAGRSGGIPGGMPGRCGGELDHGSAHTPSCGAAGCPLGWPVS